MLLNTDLLNIVDRWEINGENVIPQVERRIRYEDLDFAPLITFMVSIGNTKKIGDVSWKWPESRAETFQAVCSAIAAESAGVEQTVTIKAGVVIGQQLFHGSTRQTFIVTDFISKQTDTTAPGGISTTVKILKMNNAATTAVTGSPVLRLLALRTPTGGFYPIGQGSTPVWHTNNVQLCTNVISVSTTEMAVENWYGSQFQKDIREKVQQHKGNNERVIWWGQGNDEYMELTNEDGNVSRGQVYNSQGIDDRIQTHRTPYTVLDKPTIMSWLNAHCFGSRNSGPKEQLWVCGPDAMQAINEIGENQFVALPEIQELGLDIKQFKAWGERKLRIVEEREFYGDGVNKTESAGSIYKLNPDNMGIKYLQSTFMQSKPVNLPNRDMEALLLRSEWGFEFALEQQAALLYQLQ